MQTLAAWCLGRGCDHFQVLDVSAYSDDLPVPGGASRWRKRPRLTNVPKTCLPILIIPGKSTMPSTINLQLIGVWFCVGFFTGAGWAIATWLVGRIFSAI